MWVRRGGYIVVDRGEVEEGGAGGKEGGAGGKEKKERKIKGVIVNVVREEKEWRKMGYW